MVSPRLGHSLHRGFHLHRHSAGPAIAGMDLRRSGPHAVARHLLWAVFTPAPLSDFQNRARGRRANFQHRRFLWRRAMFTVLFLSARGARLGIARSVMRPGTASGLALAIAYLLAATVAHHARFPARETICRAAKAGSARRSARCRLPPSIWHWDGLVRAPRGVYEVRMDLSDDSTKRRDANATARSSRTRIIQTRLPMNTLKWRGNFPRCKRSCGSRDFPSRSFTKKAATPSWSFLIYAFPQIRRDRPASFTYRVRFSADGKGITQGWVRR